MQFTVKLTEDKEDGGYTVQCIELPGAISQGDTIDEALENIKEAIMLVLEDMQSIDAKTEHIVKVEVSV